MRFYLTSLVLLLYFQASSQKTEKYYDYNWSICDASEARFYSTEEKTDSGWLRKDYFVHNNSLQMQALYEDKDCKTQNGYCRYFFANGQLSSEGRKVHGKREGIYIGYHSNGMMLDSAFYHNDIPVAARLRWHRNGFLADSINHVNDSVDVEISWYDNGSLSSAGYLLHGKPSAKWKYYHPNGQLSGEVIYQHGKEISAIYFQEDGTTQSNHAKANSAATFAKGGEKGWINYMRKNLYWPSQYQFATSGVVTVGVSFTINEEGKAEDIELTVPFHPEFDQIAVDIIRKSPVWKPAISHNRKIKAYFRQPVSFQQN